MIYILALILTLLGNFKPSSDSINVRAVISLDTINTERQHNNYLYYDNLLIWNGFPSQNIFTYDLKEEILKVIKVPLGRGPSEVQMIRDLVITNDGILYLFDARNLKYLSLDPKIGTTSLKEHRYKFKDKANRALLVMKASQQGGVTIINCGFQSKKFIQLFDLDSGVNIPLKFGESVSLNEFPNPMYRTGELEFSGHRVVFAPKYQPRFLLFDPETKSLDSHVWYGPDASAGQPSQKMDNGAVMMGPPQGGVPLVSMATIPGDDDSALLVRRGSENGKQFNTKTIYQYNLISGELEGELRDALAEADEGPVEVDRREGQCLHPRIQVRHGIGDRVRHPGTGATRTRIHEREERHDRSGRSVPVSVVEVIGSWVVEIHGALDEPLSEDARVEFEVRLRRPADCGDVVQARDRALCRHGSLLR